jgi:ABC-2 type transport system permease protein
MPIFDQGYQHWTGELSGHSWRWLAIARQGVRIGMKSSILRLLLLLSWIPAVGLAFFLAVWGLVEQGSPLILPLMSILTSILDPELLRDPKSHRLEVWALSYDYFLNIELYLSMVLMLIVGPSLISQDIRFNAMPLYFSRPLRRIDYFLGKFGIIGYFLGIVLIVPSIIAYVLGLLFSLDITILYGAIMTLSAGLLMLALSSLSRNSRYVGLFWVGVWVVTGLTGLVVEKIERQERRFERQRKFGEMEYATRQKGQKLSFQEQQRLQQEERMKAIREMNREEFEAGYRNWHPMFSYTANLNRVGDALLGTGTAWRKLSLNKPEEEQGGFLLRNVGPHYPWQWSAIVLLVLLGISVCILNLRVRSLDRLR